MESGRAYDLFPFISAPVKCGFRKALVVSMVSWATIFEISFFFICYPAAAFRQPVSIQPAGRFTGGKGVAYRQDGMAYIDFS